MLPNTVEVDVPRAPLWRHMFAVVYDLFLIIPLLMVTSALLVAFHGPADSTALRSVPAWQQWILAFLALIGFFGLFWRKQGQTLGMQAWRVKLVAMADPMDTVTWLQSVKRVLVAMLPFVAALIPYAFVDITQASWLVHTVTVAIASTGFLWRFTNQDRHYLHDVASRTELVLTPKRTGR